MKSPAILIFDQEEAVRESLRLVLSEEGFRCFISTNEQDVLEALKAELMDMAILDSQIVGTTSLLKKIKEQYPHLKVIIMSSYSEFEVTQRALAAGADNFVFKPLDFEELITQMRLLLPEVSH
ncbi:MAG: response regulator [Balneolaceae bacterium]|jgi:DNA-binding NtrC family response regulator